MILLTLSRGKGEETVRLQLPASPAEIGETFAFLDRISLDTTATAILDVSSNVPVLYRCLYDVDVEDSEQFQKLQKLAERTEALSPAKAAIFSGALDAECVWNLEGALTVADRLDEYIVGLSLHHDRGPHERQGILQRGAKPALPIAHTPDSAIPQDAVQILSVRVVVDLARLLIQSDVSHGFTSRL